MTGEAQPSNTEDMSGNDFGKLPKPLPHDDGTKSNKQKAIDREDRAERKRNEEARPHEEQGGHKRQRMEEVHTDPAHDRENNDVSAFSFLEPAAEDHNGYSVHKVINNSIVDDAVLLQFGDIKLEENGYTIECPLAGQVGSSTRSECLGAIAGISAPGPRHLGIDNATVVMYAKQLCHIAQYMNHDTPLDGHFVRGLLRRHCTGELRKPWGLQKHGD